MKTIVLAHKIVHLPILVTITGVVSHQMVKQPKTVHKTAHQLIHVTITGVASHPMVKTI